MSKRDIKPICSLYAANSGLEITPEHKFNSRKKQSEGRIQLRFFILTAPTTGKTTQLKFILEPGEAYDLYHRMRVIYAHGGKDKLVHKFAQGDEVTTTTLSFDKWEKGNKSGLGISIGRGDTFISVPFSKESTSRFLYAAEFLKFLSVRQAWIEPEARA